MALGEHVVEDYRTLGLSLKAHPMALLREEIAARGAIRAEKLTPIPNGRRVRVSGLVLVRQRPGTASGVIFMTLEDESGIANVVVWPKVFEQFRREVLAGRFVAVDGPVQRKRRHPCDRRAHSGLTPLLAKLQRKARSMRPRAGMKRAPIAAPIRASGIRATCASIWMSQAPRG